jgi:hypothetical protein
MQEGKRNKKISLRSEIEPDQFRSSETSTHTSNYKQINDGLKNHDVLIGGIQNKLEKEFPQKLAKVEERFENDKVNVVEVIGAFVAFFTFISVEINIFRLPLSLWSLVGFSLLNLSMMTFFISTIQTILRNKLFSCFQDFFRSVNFLLILISIVLMLVATFTIYKGQDANPKMIFLDKENDRNKYILLEDQSFLSTLIYKKIEDGDRETRKDIEKIKQCLSSANYVYQIKSCLPQ